MEYKYYSIHRPVSIGTYPKNYLMSSFENYDNGAEYVEEINRKAWGELYYRQPLSDLEMSDYELVQSKAQEERVQVEKKKQVSISEQQITERT